MEKVNFMTVGIKSEIITNPITIKVVNLQSRNLVDLEKGY